MTPAPIHLDRPPVVGEYVTYGFALFRIVSATALVLELEPDSGRTLRGPAVSKHPTLSLEPSALERDPIRPTWRVRP
jgi:hypothetical protein